VASAQPVQVAHAVELTLAPALLLVPIGVLLAVVLFVQALLLIGLDWLVGALFTTETVAQLVGFAYFLAEVRIADSTVCIATPDRSTPARP